jgi:sulfite exporter TauE/SafE
VNYWLPLALGLTGSLHCVGMCGPLIWSTDFGSSARKQLFGQWVYHMSRVAMYAGLGLVFGLIGQTLVVAGLQKVLSIAGGFLLVSFALFGGLIETWLSKRTSGLVHRLVESGYRYIRGAHDIFRWFILGLLNGIVPCGLVYAALAGAIATGSAVQGALFMVLFGLGTWPLLFAAGFSGQGLKKMLRGRVGLVRQAVLLISGLLLIQRGFNLDLTLFESAVVPAQVDCHPQ